MINRLYELIMLIAVLVQVGCNENSSPFISFPYEINAVSHIDKAENRMHISNSFEIECNLTGNTIYGITAKGKRYALYYQSPSTLYLLMEDGRLEKGSYWIDQDGVVHGQWPTIHAGSPTAVRYYLTDQHGSRLEFVTASGRLQGLLRRGDAERLVERYADQETLRALPNFQ